ncbi:MAG: glycosyltransferase, partial [Glaciimonas sp.]|nr:glycosyltransferase [Glaciimonas sp.]
MKPVSPTRIVIFAKAPLPGFAKTRLIPALGAQGAA